MLPVAPVAGAGSARGGSSIGLSSIRIRPVSAAFAPAAVSPGSRSACAATTIAWTSPANAVAAPTWPEATARSAPPRRRRSRAASATRSTCLPQPAAPASDRRGRWQQIPRLSPGLRWVEAAWRPRAHLRPAARRAGAQQTAPQARLCRALSPLRRDRQRSGPKAVSPTPVDREQACRRSCRPARRCWRSGMAGHRVQAPLHRWAALRNQGRRSRRLTARVRLPLEALSQASGGQAGPPTLARAPNRPRIARRAMGAASAGAPPARGLRLQREPAGCLPALAGRRWSQPGCW